MAKIAPPKESLEGLPPLPSGIHTFRLDGFKPKKSKQSGKPGKSESLNLNPTMPIINDANLTKRQIPENLNSLAGWVQKDFVHSLGQKMQDGALPGEFVCKVHGPNCADLMGHPEHFTYQGPLSGQTGQCETTMVPNNKGGMRAAVKRYICRVPGCTEYHNENLASS